MATGGYTIISMNANGDEGNVVDRRHSIFELVKARQPDLVFLQELSSFNKLNNYLNEKADDLRPGSYCMCEGVKDSAGGYTGFIFNENSLLVEQYDFRRTYHQLQDSGHLTHISELPTRLFIRRVSSKGKPDINLLVAAYHGRQKLGPAEKENVFRQLLTLLERESRITRLNILVGGDFNFIWSNAQDILDKEDKKFPNYHLHTKQPTERKKGMVDYFLYKGPRSHVHSVEVGQKHFCFDHRPLFAVFHQTAQQESPRTRKDILNSNENNNNNRTCDLRDVVCSTKPSPVAHLGIHEDTVANNSDNKVVIPTKQNSKLKGNPNKDIACSECGHVCKNKAGLTLHMCTHQGPQQNKAISMHVTTNQTSQHANPNPQSSPPPTTKPKHANSKLHCSPPKTPKPKSVNSKTAHSRPITPNPKQTTPKTTPNTPDPKRTTSKPQYLTCTKCDLKCKTKVSLDSHRCAPTKLAK